MTTFDASQDYWSDTSTRLGRSSFQVEMEEAIAAADQRIRADRRQARNHFLRFVLVNLLIWPIVAFIGFQVMDSHKPEVSEALLKTSGAQSMTADELISVVRGQERPIFWLGRLSGDTYAENSTVSGVDVISYLPEHATPQTARQLDLIIKTYRNSNIFNAHLRPLSGTPDTTVEIVGGVTVTYRPASPNHSVVTFKDRPQVVTLTYPAFQTVSTLVMDAQNLDSIQ